MGGQVLGGGVIVLVAALLWLVYLLPSWHSRKQYDAAERNALRLSQALRVLAETSETPEEVRVELSTRTALAQQKLAKRAMAERESHALEGARVALEQARTERVAAQWAPAARQARARRRLRLGSTVLGVAGGAVAVLGGVQLALTGVSLFIWIGVPVMFVSTMLLRRMSVVAARSVRLEEVAVTRAPAIVQDVTLEQTPRAWAPRDLPKPLTAEPGSRAAAVLDAEAARAALRQAALEEAMRERQEAQRPPSIESAPSRVARVAEGSPYATMGYVDDAEIEAHVRDLLARRAVGS